MNKKSLLLWTAVLSLLGFVAVVVPMVVFARKAPPTFGDLKQPLTAADHSFGDQSAPLVLVVYSDFQCASCGIVAQDLKQVQEQFGTKVRVVHRHFPLPQHKNAVLAACAAEAAGKQGKYFEMHDLLFEKAEEWGESDVPMDLFLAYAVDPKLALDTKRFRDDVAASETMQKVKGDETGALDSGARGTPAVYVNGRFLPGPLSFQRLKGAVNVTLNR